MRQFGRINGFDIQETAIMSPVCMFEYLWNAITFRYAECVLR